jgi:hypothetical protein
VHRWLHILGIGYALPQILDSKGGDEVAKLANTTPWREKDPVTAGRVRWGLGPDFWPLPDQRLVEQEVPEIRTAKSA